MPSPAHLIPGQRADRPAYEDRGGYAGLAAAIAYPDAARQVLLTSTLTGLGGAHFPFARKAALAQETPGPRVVVCNAAEDEPGSQKDRTLLETNPHVVIEGALIAATLIEADEVYFYVSEILTGAQASLNAALGEYAEYASTAGNVALHLALAPQRYVAGEASAAIDSISGGEGKPLFQPPYPTESGVHGKPTLVANCETLANLPRIVRAGLGVDSATTDTRTRLATITGDIANPGVYEIDPATDTVDDLIQRAGGVTGSGVLKAFQPGGPSSAFLSAESSSIALSDESIRAAGSQPGCLAVRIITTDQCMVEVVEQITDFFRREQCGQCPPCRMKTQTYHRTVYQISHHSGGWDLLDKLAVVDEFVRDMPRRCALIDMPVPAVASARVLFHDDFATHIDHHSCAAQSTPLLPLAIGEAQ